MTHIESQHTHPKDPPKRPNAPNSPWSIPGAVERLKELWTGHSATQIASLLSREFQVEFTRNATISKLHRLKLTVNDKTRVSNRTQRAKRTDIPVNKPKLKIIRAAGNSSALKLIYSVETEAAPLQCVEVTPRHLGLLDLEDDDCRAPYGEGGPDSPFTFCGLKKLAGTSYCPAHARLFLTPATPPKRRVAA